MAAYVLVEVEVHDEAEYEGYKRLTPATIAAHGGRFVVRGGKAELVEGQGEPKRIVVLEFPDMAAAKRWWSSPEYAVAKAIRQRTATTRMLFVEGA